MTHTDAVKERLRQRHAEPVNTSSMLLYSRGRSRVWPVRTLLYKEALRRFHVRLIALETGFLMRRVWRFCDAFAIAYTVYC